MARARAALGAAGAPESARSPGPQGKAQSRGARISTLRPHVVPSSEPRVWAWGREVQAVPGRASAQRASVSSQHASRPKDSPVQARAALVTTGAVWGRGCAGARGARARCVLGVGWEKAAAMVLGGGGRGPRRLSPEGTELSRRAQSETERALQTRTFAQSAPPRQRARGCPVSLATCSAGVPGKCEAGSL